MCSYPLLLGFGFGNLAMLGWLAAAAAPVLIHLWSRHRHREAPWAAMQFLLAAMRKNARRMQLQQWLLLAVRTLLIVLIVVAAADPYGERLVAGGNARPTHTVLVLDASYSMAYGGEGTSRFGRAKQLAAALVRESRPADTFTVVLMAEPARKILGPELIDRSSVAARIEALAPSQTKADLSATLTLTEEAVDENSKRRRSRDRQEVCFFTDLQRSTWMPGGEAPDEREASELHDRIARIARRASLRVVDLGEPAATNLAITRVAAAEPLATPDREIALDVTLRQFGNEPRPQCLVELLVDGATVGEQTVDVPAGGEASLRFTHRFQSAGDHSVTVRAERDRLAIDDARYLAVPVQEEIRVLCVEGREGAAQYVAKALNPNPAGGSPIRPTVISEGELAETAVSEFDCVYLCNVAQLAPGEAERLRRYTANGGGIVIFLGDRVVPENYNSLATSQGGSGANAANRARGAAGVEPLLPARLGEIVSNEQLGLDPLDYRHPIVAPFRGRERAGLLTTPVARYFRLEAPQGDGRVQVAAAMPSGDPFIVAASSGRGRTVLVATAASLSSVDASGEPWTQWPTWPSFLPIVRELLTFATGGSHSALQHEVGATLGGVLPTLDSSRTVEMIRPDGRGDAVSMQSPDGQPEWHYSGTDVCGTYRLRGLPGIASSQFAVNVDTAESDLAKADSGQLPPQFVLNELARPTEYGESEMPSSGVGWNQSLLWAALALLCTESLLAWQFSKGAL
jgi:hypothetical protein